MYVTIVSLVFLGLCFSGVTGVRQCKYGAEYDEVTSQCVCRFACRRLYRPVCGTDGKGYVNDCAMAAAACESQREIRSIDSSLCSEYDSGDATDMADNKEQEALRVLEAPTTSNDEKLGVDAVDVVETMMNQDATGEQVQVSHGLRQYGNDWNVTTMAPVNTTTAAQAPTTAPNEAPRWNASYLASYNGWHYYKVPVSGAMTSTNVKTACETAGYVTPCNGYSGCRYASSSCVLTGLNNCGSPMSEISQALCGRVPRYCPQMYGVYQFMNNWSGGSACGAESGNWCASGSRFRDRYAFCARGWNVTTIAPVSTTIAAQGPTTAPNEAPNCDQWTGWFNRDHPSGSGDYEQLLHLRPENPGKICSTPSAIQARVRGSQVPASQTGEHFFYYNTVDGFACRNAEQSDRYCQDYEVRFCCSQNPNPGWNVTTMAPVSTAIATQGSTTAPDEASKPCPKSYEHVVSNGETKCVRFSTRGDRKSYQAAGQICRDEGARLVVIKSAELDTFIDNRIKTTYAAETWIGLDDLTAPASQYRWSDGSVLGSGDFNDWSPGQPDTIYREKCVEIRPQFSYHWNNHHCNLPKNYICEIPWNVTTIAPVKPTIPTQGPTTAPNEAPKRLPTPPADISASTTCTNEYMELSIPEDQLTDINSNNLHWEPDRNCGATTNGTHYIFRTQLYGCGTQVKFGPRYVEFLNTINILGIHFNTGVITRDSDISITSKCNYERQEWVESTFLPIPGGLNFTEEGFGQLEVRLSMFPTRQYQRQYQANQYPIHLRLRQHVYMQLEVQGHGQKLSVLALNCKATMSPSPNDSLQYQLIRDGCASDPTLKTYDVDDPGKERFGFEAFRFIREVRTVYVHCEVLVCDAADSGSRCAQGCVKRGKRAAGHADMRGRHMIYQGPIILDDDKEDALHMEHGRQTTGPGPRSGLWTTMAAGGVLMALALLVIGAATILKRSCRDKWTYQGLPNMEEDGE